MQVRGVLGDVHFHCKATVAVLVLLLVPASTQASLSYPESLSESPGLGVRLGGPGDVRVNRDLNLKHLTTHDDPGP